MRPRIRTLKPEMWADERIGVLSRDARLLLLGLITMADDEGRFRARRSAILGHVFPADDDALDQIDIWIAEIKQQAIVVFYVVDAVPYGAFRHWRRHQKINRPTPSDLPPSPDPKVTRDNKVKRQRADTDRSGTAPGAFSESSGNTHSSTRRRAFRSDPDPVEVQRLSHRLADHIRHNDPKADPSPDCDRWLTDMRLLVTDRGGDLAEVERVLDWCQDDSFWRCNVLSPGKLRMQFTQLLLKADGGLVVPMRPANASDLLRAIDGGAA